jgi:hypothetical protein
VNTDDERNINPIQEMLRIVQSVLNLSSWGFKESYRSVTDNRLIYDSEFCRIKIVWGGWDPLGGNSVSIYYGRLHAPNDNVTMIWDGEECHAWHSLKPVIHFLDGRSPNETFKMGTSHPLTDKYYEDEFRQKFHRRQPEWLMKMLMDIWEHYDNKFFELFDLRRSDLWEQYRRFLIEFYDIKGRRRSIAPARDKIC